MEFIMFTKMLKNIGGLDAQQSADYLAEMGFEGADLTVRPGGHVLPKDATKELPKIVKIFQSRGLSVPMITTAIIDANEKYVKEIFTAASQSGVKFLKMGGWSYNGFGTIKKQIEEVRDKILRGIVKLSKEYGVTAAVHIHSGNNVSANAAILYMLLKEYDPDNICAYIDPGHMVVEGGLSGWKIGMDLLQDHIKIVAIKDMAWSQDSQNQKKWTIHWIPLSEGMVPWNEFFTYLRSMRFNGPLSFHSEYKNTTLGYLIQQTKEDLKYIKDLLKSF